MQQPKPSSESYPDIVQYISKGKYQIPKFQRDFVWTKGQTAHLIDSLIKGFPIGTFILWKTSDRLKSTKELGGIKLPEPKKGEEVYYVLDGQQRLTSLYLALKGIKIRNTDYKEIYINLDKEPETDDEICTLEKTENSISFYDLMNGKIMQLAKEFDEEIGEKIEAMREIVGRYDFSTIEIKDQPLEKIAEIFTRINTGGKALDLFEVVCAKVYTEEEEVIEGESTMVIFDLEKEFNDFINHLEKSHYETIKTNKSILPQLISLMIKDSAKKKDIFSIDKKDFIAKWDRAIECANKAIEKIIGYFHVPTSKLLPYPALIVPMACFYDVNGLNDPSPKQLKLIKNHFFRTALTNRFNSATETKLGNDKKIMLSIKNNSENIKEELEKEIPISSLTEDEIKRKLKEDDISSKNAFDKAVLCIMAGKTPKRFNDNSLVIINDSWLSKSSLKNYHHFFPKAFLKGQGNDKYADSLANITIIDGKLNREISDKAPSEYIGKIADENPDGIEEALESHFIGYEGFGIFDNDYDTFLEQRASLLAKEIIAIITDFG